MIDSHCHLDRCEDLEVALDNDLRAMVTVGTDPDRSRTALRLAEAHARVFAAVGVHPNDASIADDPDVRRAIEEAAAHPRTVAIGETGFDTHWHNETLDSQRRAFDWQADLARRCDKPLILHVRDRDGSREASAAAADALRAAAWPRGVLHCFGGDEELLRTGLELGWMVSFAGNLTYKSAANLRAAAAEVPRDRLLVETDAPFLAPVPKRGKRNVPGFVEHTARVLAEVRAEARSEDPHELEAVLDANAERLYRLSLEPTTSVRTS